MTLSIRLASLCTWVAETERSLVMRWHALVLTLAAVAPVLSCPTGWSRAHTQCVRVTLAPVPFHEAAEACRKLSPPSTAAQPLALDHSEAEEVLDTLVGLFDGPVWTGLAREPRCAWKRCSAVPPAFHHPHCFHFQLTHCTGRTAKSSGACLTSCIMYLLRETVLR